MSNKIHNGQQFVNIRIFVAAFHVIALIFSIASLYVIFFDSTSQNIDKYVFSAALIPSLMVLLLFRGVYSLHDDELYLSGLYVIKIKLLDVRAIFPLISWDVPWLSQSIGTLLIIAKGKILPVRIYIVRAVGISEICERVHSYKRTTDSMQ